MEKTILISIYLVASVLFIFGLKMLSHPEKARKGNIWAAAGMIVAIISTLVLYSKDGIHIYQNTHNIILIIVALIIGTIIGWSVALKVKMTAMPQLVSLFNGMGGACAALISISEFPHIAHGAGAANMLSGEVLDLLLGLVIGSVSFSGSMIAFGKLNGNIGDIRAKFMRYINILSLVAIVATIVYIMSMGHVSASEYMPFVYGLLAFALLWGVIFVMPIGGADMPVVISLLNSFTGVAAATGGFLYNNQAMLTGGILVGSAGTILTILMCKAMNRSLLNVLVGAFGGGGSASGAAVEGSIKEISVNDSAVLLGYSQRVVVVPGYGLAVAQAQHLCHELEKILEDKGVELRYAIHPVAGRMPGHMNVLLAEADVSYEKLIEMDEINPDMPNTDVVVIIGANDVVNPAAETDASSPIFGMPIIKAYEAKNIIVMKRGAGKGYAGIENALFYNDKTKMLYGDAKATLQKLVSEIKSL